MQHQRTVRCYAEGRGDDWEAFCLDFDLAVQGRSFEDVYSKLNDQIVLYIEHVISLPESDQARLLHRSVPLSMRITFIWRLVQAALTNRDGTARHEYVRPMSELPCAA